MRTYGLTPLFRSTIGLDRWNDLFDSVFRADEASVACPPYNIEKVGQDSYRITMALAGFTEDDLNVTVQENLVTVAGKVAESREDKATNLLSIGK